jgi:cytochrome oxidase Cu insertion factor (SCO1/SenC/PrrC family)
VWVASFVFTRCTGPCPAVTASVARLQKELNDQPDVRLVTFTVDPDRDTPDELKKYADRYGADPKRWLFLTGKEDEIHKLATDGFKLLAAKKADPKPGDEFDHSTKLAVVDRRGVVRAVFDGMAVTRGGESDEVRRSVERLAAKVAELAKE